MAEKLDKLTRNIFGPPNMMTPNILEYYRSSDGSLYLELSEGVGVIHKIPIFGVTVRTQYGEYAPGSNLFPSKQSAIEYIEENF